MIDGASGLPAHKGLRGQILLELKKSQPLTARELAERYRVTPNAIRRHLKELESEHLVDSGRMQRGRGAPMLAYRLSAQGEGLFPRRYAEELTDVLVYLEQRGGREEVRRYFDEHFRTQADSLMAQLEDSTVEERIQAVVDHLQRQGFMADWSSDGQTVRIAEHNCAVHAVAQRYPELCEAEAAFLKEILQADVQRAAYIPLGCNACEYAVSISGANRDPRPEQP